MDKDIKFEDIGEDVEDDYSDDSLFNISSWGADLSFREIISMYDEDELVKPELQRKYVWDRSEASRFIESLLMGLPVPSIFFAKSGSQQLIVDGYQRIMTVYDYIQKGIFSGDGKIFRLSNSEKINLRWRNKAFKELSLDDQRKIRSTTIHAIIFEQKKPENDDTSMYQIFERINTGGRTLTPQEIRNCVYQGSFNRLLFELNELKPWRTLYGSKEVDSRMRDIECILRFFVMKSTLVQDSKATRISLKKCFNDFMRINCNVSKDSIEVYRHEFMIVMESILRSLGEKAFRNYSSGKYTRRFNPALFDAISVAYYQKMREGVLVTENITERNHKDLFLNDDFVQACKQHTTDIINIRNRIDIAKKIIFEEA